MKRRRFIKLAGTFLATAQLPFSQTGCKFNSDSLDNSVNAPDSDATAALNLSAFPQGVASGDPKPNSVVIWTRAHPRLSDGERVNVFAEMALDEGFTSLVLQQSYSVESATDFTLRIVVTELQADTRYFYRFKADNAEQSIVGRTWTAPMATDATPIRFAFASCQDQQHGHYSAYRHLIIADENRPLDQQLRFVLHLGDFIYETRNDPLQSPIDKNFAPIPPLANEDGRPRVMGAFPNGGITPEGVEFAESLADYRHLYKTYLLDPDLQAARARWPFIQIWDDHEFSDDCWQSEANYTANNGLDEPSQPRKVAANQAWYEFIPVDYSVTNEAESHLKAFTYQDVANTPNLIYDENGLAVNADNIAALKSICIFRKLQFGSLVDLVITDNRSYRSDHAIPEAISGNLPMFKHPRVALPKDLVEQLDAGRTANNGDPHRVLPIGNLVLNPRAMAPPGTILGHEQKRWWKSVMSSSRARWKVWANSVPLMRMSVDLSSLDGDLPDIILSGDAWDGYASERDELAAYLVQNDIFNVVSLAGDLHAHYAGVVMYGDDSPTASTLPVATELVCGAISSMSQFAAVERLTRIDKNSETTPTDRALRKLVTYDANLATSPTDDKFVINLNNTLLNGVRAGLAAADSNDRDTIEASANVRPNPHLRFCDTNAHGYGIFEVDELGARGELIAINVDGDRSAEATLLYSASFSIPEQYTAGTAHIQLQSLVGTPPFPMRDIK